MLIPLSRLGGRPWIPGFPNYEESLFFSVHCPSYTKWMVVRPLSGRYSCLPTLIITDFFIVISPKCCSVSWNLSFFCSWNARRAEDWKQKRMSRGGPRRRPYKSKCFWKPMLCKHGPDVGRPALSLSVTVITGTLHRVAKLRALWPGHSGANVKGIPFRSDNSNICHERKRKKRADGKKWHFVMEKESVLVSGAEMDNLWSMRRIETFLLRQRE